MARLSINQVTTSRWSFDEDVANYRALGIQAIGVWRPKLADFGEERGIDLLAEQGLAASSLSWVGGFTGSEGPSFTEMLEDAREAVRLAAALDAGCLVVYSGGRGIHARSHARRILIDALKDLDPLAAELGVTLALEPMHPAVAEPCTLLTTAEETIDVIDTAGCRATKLVFDTYHLGHGHVRLDRVASLASRVAVAHLADSRGAPHAEQNRCRLGDGILPLADIIAALADGGFDGDYEVELFGELVESEGYRDLIAHSRGAFSQVERQRPRTRVAM